MEEEVDEVDGRDVEEDVFEVEEDGEEEGAQQVAAAVDGSEGQNEDTEQETIVLEVNVCAATSETTPVSTVR